MIISVKKVKGWSKFILLFTLFTLLLYQLIAFFAPYFRPDIMYHEPTGGAVKVFAQNESKRIPTTWYEIKNRLLIFYELGE